MTTCDHWSQEVVSSFNVIYAQYLRILFIGRRCSIFKCPFYFALQRFSLYIYILAVPDIIPKLPHGRPNFFFVIQKKKKKCHEVGVFSSWEPWFPKLDPRVLHVHPLRTVRWVSRSALMIIVACRSWRPIFKSNSQSLSCTRATHPCWGAYLKTK